MRKNKFFGFCFSFLPGAAHMYIGLMRQGVQLMTSFFLLIGLNTFFTMVRGLSIMFIVLIPVLYCFAFFDGIRKVMSDEVFTDDDTIFFNIIKENTKFIKHKNKVFAWVLIIIGSYMLLDDIVFRVIATLISNIYGTEGFYRYMQLIRNVVVSFLLIGAGAFLLKGNNTKGSDK